MNSRVNAFLITILTENRECSLGRIEDGKINLTKAGVIADIVWHELSNVRNYLIRDEYIITPNHLHGIFILNFEDAFFAEISHCINHSEKFKNNPKISNLVRSFKSTVKKHTNRLQLPFAWHNGFHCQVIKNYEELEIKRLYVRQNNLNWKR